MPNRAEQEDECLKLIKVSFSPVDQGLQYVSPSFCVCVYVYVCNSFPCLQSRHTHIFASMSHLHTTQAKHQHFMDVLQG